MPRLLLATLLTAALAAPAAADDHPPVQPCPHGSDFYYGYNRGVVVTLPGYEENPMRLCIEI